MDQLRSCAVEDPLELVKVYALNREQVLMLGYPYEVKVPCLVGLIVEVVVPVYVIERLISRYLRHDHPLVADEARGHCALSAGGLPLKDSDPIRVYLWLEFNVPKIISNLVHT